MTIQNDEDTKGLGMARKRDDAAVAENLPSEDQVISFLKHHPDFLLRHAELLLVLSPPSRWTSADGVVDMQVFMIQQLRDELERVRGTAEHVIHTSRSNLSTQNRTHQAVVALLGATSVANLAEVVSEDLPQLLDVDMATLCFEPTHIPVPELITPGVRALGLGDVTRLLGGEDRDCALNDEMPGDPLLFGESASLVQSSAIVRLPVEQTLGTVGAGHCPPGVLALGSRHGHTFHMGQGTELLNFLSHVIASSLGRFIG